MAKCIFTVLPASQIIEDLYKELQAKAQTQSAPQTPAERRKPNANHQGRRPLPPELQREIIEIEPDAAEKVCDTCDSFKQRIGE